MKKLVIDASNSLTEEEVKFLKGHEARVWS